MKAKLILLALKIFMVAVTLGIGIWYLSSSIGGGALTYTSVDNFLIAVGATDGDVASVNGCFLCRYLTDLFTVLGDATGMFWERMLNILLVLMALGFGLFMIITGVKHVWEALKDSGNNPNADDKRINAKPWVDKVVKQGIRVLFVSALLGGLAFGGTDALRFISNLIITPVLYVGAELAMMASGISDGATCGALATSGNEILGPVLGSFMCVIGNINSVILAGASGGFALMNYAWLGMGGGAFTWVAGLGLVLMFLVIGFDLFFQILSVIFKLIFVIIFMPFLLVAYAFEGAWKVAGGLFKSGINMVVKSAVQIVIVSLKVVIIYATVAYASDAYMPGPVDGYSAILPPIMGMGPENPDTQTMAVIDVFAQCEKVGLSDGEMDKDKFTECFNEKKSQVESVYPDAFGFLDDGWDFMVMMFGLFFIYFYVIKARVDNIIGKESSEQFDFGGQLKLLGQKIWAVPKQIGEAIAKAVES